tara:strand:- start:5185 stop:5784 length:600 start_codon:yes stop_codon:yes gene_type:complete
MLQLPEAPPIYRILSIDPGSDTLGIALIDVDLCHFTATLVHANTLNATRAIRQFPFTVETFGERQARLNTHASGLRDYLFSARPHCVISEAPYMGRFPQAFETLVECMYMMRGVVAEYDPSMCMETIDSPSAKKAVGAPGKRPKGMSKEAYKETVRHGIRALPKLHLAPGVLIDHCDEHAIDAIAVGCYKVRCIANDIL